MPRPRSLHSRTLDPSPAQAVGGVLASAVWAPNQLEYSDGYHATPAAALAAISAELTAAGGGMGVLIVQPQPFPVPGIITWPAGDYDFEGRIALSSPYAMRGAGILGLRPFVSFEAGALIRNCRVVQGLTMTRAFPNTAGTFLIDFPGQGIEFRDCNYLSFSGSGITGVGLVEADVSTVIPTEIRVVSTFAFGGASAFAGFLFVEGGTINVIVAEGSEIGRGMFATPGGNVGLTVARGADCIVDENQIGVTSLAFSSRMIGPFVTSDLNTAVVTAAYIADAGELVRFDPTAGTFTIDLPRTVTGQNPVEVQFKNVTADATAITVRPSAGLGTIDGAASVALGGGFAKLRLMSGGNAGTWHVVAS